MLEPRFSLFVFLALLFSPLAPTAVAASTDIALFSNPEDGYSIVFPKDWQTQANYLGTSVFSTSPQSGPLDDVSENINIVAEKFTTPITSDQYFQANLTSMKRILKNLNILESAPVNVGGFTAVRAVITHDVNHRTQKNISYFLATGGRAYVITCSAEPQTFDAFKNVFDSVVATFKMQ